MDNGQLISRKKKCIVYTKHKKRSDTRYKCRKCNIDLNIDDYFEIYDTQMNF